jgi:two-component system response regulator PrrA
MAANEGAAAGAAGTRRREPGEVAQRDAVRTLLVDGNGNRRRPLALALARLGHEVTEAPSPRAAVTVPLEAQEVLVLVPCGAPPSGIDELARLRAATDRPLIFVSDEADAAFRVATLDAGADGYVAHPVDPLELDRRVRALARPAECRRTAERLEGPAGLQLQVRAREVVVGGERLPVTRREFHVLRELLEHRGEVVSAERLSMAGWGHAILGTRNYVESQVARLRAKLRAAGAEGIVETVRGVGYAIR